jgi:predicted O-methyltransferase YrrM
LFKSFRSVVQAISALSLSVEKIGKSQEEQSLSLERQIKLLEETTQQLVRLQRDNKELISLQRDNKELFGLQRADIGSFKGDIESFKKALSDFSAKAHSTVAALAPGWTELGFEDPRAASSLFKALCREAQLDTLSVIKREMPRAVCELDHRSFLLRAVTHAPADGDILEFGVFSGLTLRWMAEANPGKRFVGFDSFAGLPQEWQGYKTFDFDRRGVAPQVPDNVELMTGLFRDTVPAYAATEHQIAMIHVDCDLYESASTVLRVLEHQLKPGAIIVFDEYFNYPGFREHEYKACAEFVARSGHSLEWLTYSGERAEARIV